MAIRHPTRRAIVAIVILTAVLLTTSLAFVPVQAQTPIRLKDLKISLWPEYDKEGILLIYRGDLADDVVLPVTFRFLIPKAAGQPSATAGVDASGQFHYYSYQVEDAGDFVAVTYSSPYRTFQMEYYYNPLSVDGTKRTFDYAFQADYAIDSLIVEVKQPAGAEGLTLTPAATDSGEDFDGLLLQAYPAAPIDAGQTFSLSATYDKTDPRLTSDILNLGQPGTAQFEDVARQTDNSVAYVLLGAAVTLLLGAVVYFVMQRRRRPRLAMVQAPAKPKAKASKKSVRQQSGAGYCYKCGTQLRPGADFCVKCGAKARQRG